MLRVDFELLPVILDDNSTNPYKHNEDILFDGDIIINSTYSFRSLDSQLIVKVYYELLPASLVNVTRNNEKGYRPDFVIEINTKEYQSFVIMDAKYKKVGTMENHDYENLTLKYLHGIGNTNGGFTTFLGMIIINPIVGSGVQFYQRGKYSMYGTTPSLPLIGRAELGYQQDKCPVCFSLIVVFFNELRNLRVF